MARIVDRDFWSLGPFSLSHNYDQQIAVAEPGWINSDDERQQQALLLVEELRAFLSAPRMFVGPFDDFAPDSPIWSMVKISHRVRHSHSGTGVESWHRDGKLEMTYPKLTDQDHDKHYYLGMWANEHPTEILHDDGSISSPNPGDFIIIRNSAYKHRQPKLPDSVHRTESRHFVRILFLALGCPIYD